MNAGRAASAQNGRGPCRWAGYGLWQRFGVQYYGVTCPLAQQVRIRVMQLQYHGVGIRCFDGAHIVNSAFWPLLPLLACWARSKHQRTVGGIERAAIMKLHIAPKAKAPYLLVSAGVPVFCCGGWFSHPIRFP